MSAPAPELSVAADAENTSLPRRALGWALIAFAAALPISIASLNIGAGLLTILLLVCAASGEKLPWKRAWNGLTAALLVYIGAAALCGALGVDAEISFSQLNKDVHKIWLLWLLLTTLRLTDGRRSVPMFAAAMGAVAAFGVGQGLLLRQDAGRLWVRAHGFVHPVAFGEMLAFGLLGGCCVLVLPGEGHTKRLTPRILIAYLLVTAAAFILNQTRGAFLGLGAGLAVVSAFDPKLRRWSLAMAVFGALVVVCWEFFLPTSRSILGTSVRYGLDPRTNQQLTRFVLWDIGWHMFKDHPWTGVGPGNFRTVFTHYFSGKLEHQAVWGSAHNLYVHQLAERGLLGLAALLNVLGAMTARALKRARENASALNLWALSATIAFLVMNLTEVAFQSEQITSALLFIWALAETTHDQRRAS